MKNKHIFLVDGDFFFASTFIKNLSQRGDYNIHYFASYEEASKNFNNYQPQLILIEHDLEGISGLDAISKIKQVCDNCEIVMVSNQGDITVVEKALEMGASKYFRKDILLLDHVEGLIKEKFSLSTPNWKKLFV